MYLLLVAVSARGQVNFMKQPEWKDVLTKAKTENKFIFVDAYTDWCMWCKVMDKNTFPDDKVSAVLNSKFVPVKIEMETGNGTLLAMKYRVASFPTFLVFNSDGQLLSTLVGYQKPEPFMANLEKATANPVSPYKGISSDIDLAFPGFYKKAFVKNEKGKKEMPDSAIVLKYLDSQNDLSTEVTWNVLNRFSYMTRKYDSFVLANADKLQELYGKEGIANYMQNIVSSNLKTAIKNKDEAMLRNVVFSMVDKYFPEDAEKTKTYYELDFYNRSGDFEKCLASLNGVLSKDGYEDNGSTVNGIVWNIYEKCNDLKLVQQAAALMKPVVDKEPDYAYLDTYAAILFKSKRYDEAEKYAGLAIDTGKKSNNDVKGTEQLLTKIKAERTAGKGN